MRFSIEIEYNRLPDFQKKQVDRYLEFMGHEPSAPDTKWPFWVRLEDLQGMWIPDGHDNQTPDSIAARVAATHYNYKDENINSCLYYPITSHTDN